MRRILGLQCLTALLATAAVCFSEEGLPNDSRMTLAISIAVPEQRGQRPVMITDSTSHFSVVIENVSRETLKLWRETCSFGYGALSFECADESGKQWTARKKPVSWRQNIPDSFALTPGEKLVCDIYLAAGTWEGFPLPLKGQARQVTMTAIFQVEGGAEAKAHQVWIGKVVSPSLVLTLENRTS